MRLLSPGLTEVRGGEKGGDEKKEALGARGGAAAALLSRDAPQIRR